MIVLPRIVAYIVFTVLGVAFQLPSGVPAAGGRLGIDGENFQDMAAQLNDTQQQILAVQGLKEEAMKEALEQAAAMQVPSSAAPLPNVEASGVSTNAAGEEIPWQLGTMPDGSRVIRDKFGTRPYVEPLPDRGGLQTELWGN